MEGMKDYYQSADWKKEKHVPVIQCPDQFAKDQMTEVRVTLGKEIAHPNTTEHHIEWVALYFLPEGAKFVYEVGKFSFSAHGQAPEGPNTGPVYTHHEVAAMMKTGKSGMLYAAAYCNIHGLWESSKEIKVG